MGVSMCSGTTEQKGAQTAVCYVLIRAARDNDGGKACMVAHLLKKALDVFFCIVIWVVDIFHATKVESIVQCLWQIHGFQGPMLSQQLPD